MAKSAIIIGAGIVGLATARALALRGYRITVIERNQKAVGASIRNFGMIWPIGQPDGKWYELASLSRAIWKQVCNEAKIWYDEVGSLHIATSRDEYNVLEEFADECSRQAELLSPVQTIARSKNVMTNNLRGALWSPEEMIVDPREAIAAMPHWLEKQYNVQFEWGQPALTVNYPHVYITGRQIGADEIFVCSGSDFETLFPEVYAAAPLTKCKLQMMRLAAQPFHQRIGPALCGALSLAHYKSFEIANSLAKLKERYQVDFPEHLQWGIHVMAAQSRSGEITVGDSHEYGLMHDPFNKALINELILDYLRSFARFENETVVETWNGVYPKLTNGESAFVLKPMPGVTIINGLGGAGMTLSFGLCEQVVAGTYI